LRPEGRHDADRGRRTALQAAVIPRVPPPRSFAILGRFVVAPQWDGSRVTLAVNQGVTMQTPNGSMVLAYQNVATQNNAGQLAWTSGGSQPRFLPVPALTNQPNILVHNWKANNLNVTNISAATATPIWVEAYAPGMPPPPGQTPKPLQPYGTPVSVGAGDTLQDVTAANWMQLVFTAKSGGLALFAFIGGPTDSSGNNAYVIALNASAETGPGGATPPPGYYATTVGNSYAYMLNWSGGTVFVAYFGSGQVAPDGAVLAAVPPPTVCLRSL
jgi:hypothetical protein